MSKIYKVKKDRVEVCKGYRHITWLDLLKEEIQINDWSYADIDTFTSKEEALTRFEKLKDECYADIRCSGSFVIMVSDILSIEEVTIDEDGIEEEWELLDVYIPEDEPEFWDFENDCFA